MPVYPQTNPEKISLYAEALTELRMRLRSIPDIAASDLPDRIKGESCYLQLRLATECFAIGMLAAQGDFKTFKTLTSSYSTVDIFKALAKTYPHFFPIPSIAKRTGEGQWHFDDVGYGDCSTREELEQLWSKSGNELHRASVDKYLKRRSAVDYPPIHQATERFWRLIRSHRILLSDRSSYLHVELDREGDGMRCVYMHLDQGDGTARLERYNIELEPNQAAKA